MTMRGDYCFAKIFTSIRIVYAAPAGSCLGTNRRERALQTIDENGSPFNNTSEISDGAADHQKSHCEDPQRGFRSCMPIVRCPRPEKCLIAALHSSLSALGTRLLHKELSRG